ncbi:hypothetical protein D915_008654 [Fasciola hepatica]|uniref:Uncharacterized protein n=1 Tax=Fasciola hepatica TaxID=6192 RepID=A0A4E0R7Z8_FASHE|nr:hypothetical protein D915_008654 [Fasciola hepatica]
MCGMSILCAFVYLYIWILDIIEATERCVITNKDGNRIFVLCPDYCCGNRTFQYCCNNCWASANGVIWCSQTAIISGLVLLFVGVLLVLLLVSVCAQFNTLTDWTGQLFTSQRSRITAGMIENVSAVVPTGVRNRDSKSTDYIHVPLQGGQFRSLIDRFYQK